MSRLTFDVVAFSVHCVTTYDALDYSATTEHARQLQCACMVCIRQSRQALLFVELRLYDYLVALAVSRER
jgi:hypothetical protein